jgi:hypothetical protein
LTETRQSTSRVPRYLRIDVLSGALLIVVAVAVWLGGAHLPVGELRYFGAGFLPRILSAAMLVCGVAVLIRGLIQADAAAERLMLAARGPAAVGFAILVFAATIRGFPAGPVAIPQLGLLVAGPMTVVIAGMGSVDAEPRQLIVLGIGLTVAAILVFSELLGTPMPVFPAIVAEAIPNAWGPDWPRRIAMIAYAIIGYGLWKAFGLTLADLAADRREKEAQQ